LWALTPIGRAVLPFVLAMGKALGDDYIKWVDCGGCKAYTDADGGILMDINISDSPGESLSDMFAYEGAEATVGALKVAAALMHEATESYYAINHGARAPSSRMDYVAQTFAGEFKWEWDLMDHSHPTWDPNDPNGPNGSSYGALGQSYDEWINSPDGKHYQSLPPVQIDAQIQYPGSGILPGFAGAGAPGSSSGDLSNVRWVGYTFVPALENSFSQLQAPLPFVP
jgi:hypothetical protein